MLSDLEAREEEYKALFDKDRVLFSAGSGPPPLHVSTGGCATCDHMKNIPYNGDVFHYMRQF